MKKTVQIMIMCLPLIASACTTTKYIKPELPPYTVDKITKPIIADEYRNDGVIELMRYSNNLQIELQNFQDFYDNLRESNNNTK